MGLFSSITNSLFGGSQSESGNQFADQLNSQFSGFIDQGSGAVGALGSLLGLGSPEAGQQALDQWWNSSGGQFLLNQGAEDVDAFYRSRGLANSGATIKGIEDWRSNLASTQFGQATDNLTQLAGLGLGAGNVISGAGRESESSDSSGGLGRFLGSAASLIGLSDPDAKENVEKVDTLDVVEWTYKGDDSGQRYRGVMADKAAEKVPASEGPIVDGMRTVDYFKLVHAGVA